MNTNKSLLCFLVSEISKVVYNILGNLNRPITSYGKEAVGEAAIAAYRWSRRAGYKFSITLVNDILSSICTEKHRYENQAINKKQREAGISVSVGRPRKQIKKQAPQKQVGVYTVTPQAAYLQTTITNVK